MSNNVDILITILTILTVVVFHDYLIDYISHRVINRPYHYTVQYLDVIKPHPPSSGDLESPRVRDYYPVNAHIQQKQEGGWSLLSIVPYQGGVIVTMRKPMSATYIRTLKRTTKAKLKADPKATKKATYG